MTKQTVGKQEDERSVSKYSEISRDVWVLFKKYLPISADLTKFVDDVHELNNKYEANMDEFRFMNKLLKVYFDELNRVKG